MTPIIKRPDPQLPRHPLPATLLPSGTGEQHLSVSLRAYSAPCPRSRPEPRVREITGLDQIVQDAVVLKFTAAPLTKEQLAELIQIPPRQ